MAPHEAIRIVIGAEFPSDVDICHDIVIGVPYPNLWGLLPYLGPLVVIFSHDITTQSPPLIIFPRGHVHHEI